MRGECSPARWHCAPARGRLNPRGLRILPDVVSFLRRIGLLHCNGARRILRQLSAPVCRCLHTSSGPCTAAAAKMLAALSRLAEPSRIRAADCETAPCSTCHSQGRCVRSCPSTSCSLRLPSSIICLPPLLPSSRFNPPLHATQHVESQGPCGAGLLYTFSASAEQQRWQQVATRLLQISESFQLA